MLGQPGQPLDHAAAVRTIHAETLQVKVRLGIQDRQVTHTAFLPVVWPIKRTPAARTDERRGVPDQLNPHLRPRAAPPRRKTLYDTDAIRFPTAQ